MRGTNSDIRARLAHEARINPPDRSRWHMATYALSFEVSAEAIETRGMPNLSNRWRPAHGKRGGWRRRHEPYWGERPKAALRTARVHV